MSGQEFIGLVLLGACSENDAADGSATLSLLPYLHKHLLNVTEEL